MSNVMNISDSNAADESFQRGWEREGGATEISENGAGPHALYLVVHRAMAATDYLFLLVILLSSTWYIG